jgi:hypothetical protein
MPRVGDPTNIPNKKQQAAINLQKVLEENIKNRQGRLTENKEEDPTNPTNGGHRRKTYRRKTYRHKKTHRRRRTHRLS